MVCKVFIALSNNDVAYAIEHVTENDIILTDLFCPNHKGQTVEAVFEDSSDTTLVSKVSNWFNIQSELHDFSFGYANAFYQSCIRPLSGYLTSIDKILAVKNIEHIIFHFPVSLKLKRRTSTYFLSEYESAGVILYDRHSTLMPYIEDYLEANQLKYHVESNKLALQHFIYNPIRLWSVFLLRLLGDISISIKKLLALNQKIIKGSYDELFILRTSGQAITIIPYLLSARKKICLVVSSSFVKDGLSSMLTSLTEKKENIVIVHAESPNFIKTFKIYLKTIKKIFHCRDKIFLYKGININFTQALREIIVMNAGLSIYKMQVYKKINESPSSFIFSLEQKSSHAYVDAEIARNFKTPSAQIQWCQQAFFDLPHPVFADFFLCETPKIQKCFQDSWSKHTDKLRYIGSLQGVTAEQKQKVGQNHLDNLRICLFLGVLNSSNSDLLKHFSEFAQQNKVELLVKLHPRDRKSYSSILPNATYFTSYEKGFIEFSKTFDVAVTFPSGVISDLIYSEVPFLVYIPNEKTYQDTEYEYLPGNMKPVVSISSLFKKIKKIDELNREHKLILENFRKENEIVTDIKLIESNLKDLIIEKLQFYNEEPAGKNQL
ncbi:hypothetical protein OAI66_00815 [Gammaproteobacteria bacterium]|nr:hypothetical protein [Gammaproteobacteria bacterium]